MLSEMIPESGGGSKADGFGDAVNGIAGGFEAPLGGDQSLMHEPLMRSGPGLCAKVAGEAALGHSGLPREFVKRQVAMQVALYPMLQGCESSRWARLHWRVYVLSLPAFAGGR